MSGVTLQDVQRSFTAALQDLRQSNLAAFELWLQGALAKGPVAPAAIAGQIAASRRKLADDFVAGRAAAVVETLNAGAGTHIQRQLAEFATLGELPAMTPAMTEASSPRPAGRALRAALGAALGAAAALLMLSALATRGEPARPVAVPAPAPQVTSQTATSQTATSPTHALAAVGGLAGPANRGDNGQPAPPTAHAAAAPSAKPQPPAPARNGAPASALAVIIGAFGAAIGALAAAIPGRQRGGRAKRGPAGGIAVAALALGAAGLAGRWLAGPAPWWDASLAVAAALAVWLVRALWPGDAAASATGDTAAAAALERQLRLDSAIWSALASGLVLGGQDGDRPAKELDQVRAVILAHRDRGEAGEEILRVIEQELHLPIGPRDAAAAGEAPAWRDFSWSPRHAREFDTFGIVEPGDLVRVKIPPQTTVENGTTRIIQKGVVVRKS
jgi:hypothetical protein